MSIFKSWMTAGLLLLCGVAHAGGLDVRGWLDRPGTKLLAVEFYATWCEPCMKAVPNWKALHEKYRARGLRLVVVSTMDPEGQCVNPGWAPDEMVCDPEGQIADAFGLQNKLPAAFLWSWQGDLLVGKGHVGQVEKMVEQYLARNPRVVVEAAEGKGENQELRNLVREQLISRGKIELVATDSEKRELEKLRTKSFQMRFDDKLQCELGKEVPANSLLRASVDRGGKQARLGLMMFSAETGCLLAASTVPWQPDSAQRSVAEAVDKLLSKLRYDIQMPGVTLRPSAKKEEEKKLKASLWLDWAESPSAPHGGDEKLKAYSKAIELNPDLAAAYLGRADEYQSKGMGTPSVECTEDKQEECRQKFVEKYGEKLKVLQNSLSDLNKAISIDESNPEAYAMRVLVQADIRDAEREMSQYKQPGNEDPGNFDQYNQQILSDINRAIALNSRSKPHLYEQRARLHADAKNLDKAVADMTQAIASKEAELEKPTEYYFGQRSLGEYYQDRAGLYEQAGKAELSKQDSQKAKDLTAQKEKADKEKENEETKFREEMMKNSEFGKLAYEMSFAWREKAMGMTIKQMQALSAKESKEKEEKVVKETENKIKSNKASAEDYLIAAMSFVDRSVQDRLRYYSEGIKLLKKRGLDNVRNALFLVQIVLDKARLYLGQEQFDAALSEMNEAKSIIDQHLSRAIANFNLKDFWDFLKEPSGEEQEKAKFVQLGKLNREQAEAFRWLVHAIEVENQRVAIYEKLGLHAKAREVFQYLCNTLKDEKACKSVERLK